MNKNQAIASVILFRANDKVAFVLRQNTGWMDGYYALPGGRVEPGESFSQAAIREAKEEVGVDIKPGDLKQLLIAHALGGDGEVWVNAVFEALEWEGELCNAEPEKSASLEWFPLSNLPESLTKNAKIYLEQIKAGNSFVEFGWEE
jgi:ADP-ribose pyrophosphatase YjhB (NUDIX family)